MKKLSLNKKIVGLLSIFILTSISISIIGILKIGDINSSLNNLVNVTARRLVLAKDMDSMINQLRNREKVYILEETTSGMELEAKSLEAIEQKIIKNIDAYHSIASETGKKDLAFLKSKLEEWKIVNLEMRKLSLSGQNKEAAALARGKSRITLESFGEKLDSIVERNTKVMETDSKSTDELVDNTEKLISTISTIAIITGIVLAFLIMRTISKAINKVIEDLNESSMQVASASAQIASASEELSQATTEQAASLEETAASVEEMNSMINKNTENSKNAAENSKRSQANAVRGKETVNEMIHSIDEINQSNNKIMEQINHSNAQFSDIVKVISEIGDKTKVINDIVFQTKLLSFNASVEAARAGDHGKGFAVVAEEVGNLAQMSGNAAKEISSMLDESIKKVESIINETKYSVDKLITEGRSKIENGTKVANNCGQVLEEIVQSISKVSSMADEISIASNEQAQGINEITRAMNQLDQVTQQNAATSQEAASSAEQLSGQAESLKHAVDVLIETIKGAEDSRYISSVHGARMTKNIASVSSYNNDTHPNSTAKIMPLKKEVERKVVTPQKTVQSSVYESKNSNLMPAYDDQRFKDV